MSDVDDGHATPLLGMVVELYVTVRGFSFTTSCLEMYNQAASNNIQLAYYTLNFFTNTLRALYCYYCYVLVYVCLRF